MRPRLSVCVIACDEEHVLPRCLDAIAFADARDSDGTLTTTIYLTAKPIDRKALAACAACGAELPENTFLSPRGDLVEAQRTATAEGWRPSAPLGETPLRATPPSRAWTVNRPPSSVN